MTTQTITAFLLAALTLGASTAVAQQSAEDRARRLLAEAQAHEDGERYALAAEKFGELYDAMREAHHPRAPIALWSVGFNLRRIPGRERDAIDALRRFLHESTTLTEDPEVQGFRSEAVSIIDELEARAPLQEEPEPDTEPHHAEPNAAASQTTDAATEPAMQPTPTGPAILAVGGAALLAGVITGAFSLSLDSEFRAACDDPTMCPPRLQPQYSEMRAFSVAADVLLVAGGAIAALGFVLTLTLTEEVEATASAALLSTHEVACWGYNADGQLGDDTTTQRLVPTLATVL